MKTYVAADNMITSLGFTTRENMEQFKNRVTGIRKHRRDGQLDIDASISLVDSQRLDKIFSDFANITKYTRLERMAITSVRTAIDQTDIDLESPHTQIIFSTTKGNIDLLGKPQNGYGPERMYLWRTAQIIAAYFENPNIPIVVSNACISGVLALLTAKRLLEAGLYKSIVVVGGDIASEFVVSGFQSFKAMSSKPCKPYDKNRTGLSLGEGCGTIVLTTDPAFVPNEKIVLRSGGVANDANHISAPSKTGEGLTIAIKNTLRSAEAKPETIDYISAHGTATRFNDDMESNALTRTKLASVPINSLKGYIGHTLGAAGIIETAAALQSMRENTLLATKGFQTAGTDKKLNIIKKITRKPLNHCLKLASGFGGCNAGILLSQDGTF